MYSWPLFKRVKMCWDSLKSWLDKNFPEVLLTLRKGASEEELNEVEKSLKLKLPHSTRLIYRMHDGQEISDKLLGLIGGYSVYNHLVNVGLLPLRHAITASKHVIQASKYIVIAASIIESRKFFYLNCTDNRLYVGTVSLEGGEMMPCVPDSVLKSSDNELCDGVLLWLEEHCRRLNSGMLAVREEGNQKSISQFPEKSPLCSTVVTNGVQVVYL